MRAVTFFFMDQSSSRRLEEVGEDTPTSPEVIEAYTLNFKAKIKIFAIIV